MGKKEAWFGQIHLIENLEKPSHKIPDMPKFSIVRPMIESEKISIKDQQEYQKGVGMVLYLVKQSRPDNANTTRELSKENDGANPAAFKELLGMIRYLLAT